MRAATLIALHEVIQELRHGGDAGHEQMISRPSAGDVEQVTFGVIDLLQIGVVAHRLDALLQGNYLIVAGHRRRRRLSRARRAVVVSRVEDLWD
jgi:hypothetical protein